MSDSDRQLIGYITASKLFQSFQSLGCKVSKVLGNVHCTFDTKPTIKLKGNQLASFARLVRQAALLERNQVLIADIDRMGHVVGWHFKDPD